MLIALAVIVLWVLGWNVLRVPLAHYIGARIDRQVAINGDLDVNPSLSPSVQAEGIVVGNARWSSGGDMLQLQRLAMRIDLSELLHGRVALADVRIVAPRLLLERAADGRANWQFGDAKPGSGTTMPILGLTIEDGAVRYLDAALDADVSVTVGSDADKGAPPRVAFTGSGKLRNEPFAIEGHAASPLSLRDADAPYALDVSARAGKTSIHYDGTLVPSNVQNVDGELSLQGADLSQLYPILPSPLPWTPPYRLSGHLRHAGGVWTFSPFKGTVGRSDLAGAFGLDKRDAKPLITADLTSRRLDFKDLGGLVGLPPPNSPPQARSAEQQREVALRAQTGRVLPATPYHVERLRDADVSVHFRGERIVGTTLPLQNLDARVDLAGGVLRLDPLDFGIAGGHVVSKIAIDARRDPMRAKGDLTARNLELKELVPQLRAPDANVSAGKVGGHARLSGTGNSLAAMLASSDGQVALISRGGEASTLTLVLSNLDLASAAQLLLRGDDRSTIRCVVAGFAVDNGTMHAQTMVMDTEAEKIIGSGDIGFDDEIYDLRLEARSKRPSLLALHGPIHIGGTFGKPTVHPEVAPLAARIGASLALGTLLTPLAALLPLIDTGGAKDADCQALATDVRQTETGMVSTSRQRADTSPTRR
ncbi:MAG: AsmA family protein [Betaproteobacteria bacterium]